MSSVLAAVRRGDRGMIVRAVVPLVVVAVALAAHLAIEVERSRSASIGVTLERDFIPAASALSQRLEVETRNRWVATSPSSSTTSVETLQSTGSAALAANTDAALGDFEKHFDDVVSASSKLLSSRDATSCQAPACGAAAIRAQLATFRATTDPATALTALLSICRIVPRTMAAAFFDTAAVLPESRLLIRVGAAYVELLIASYMETSTLLALFHQSKSFNAPPGSELRAVESFVMSRASLRYFLSFSDLPLGAADPLLYADIVAEARSVLAQAEAVLPVTSADVVDSKAFTLSLAAIQNLRGLSSAARSVEDRSPTSSNVVERRGLWLAVGALAIVILCLIATVVNVALHTSASSAESRLMAEFSDTERMKAVGSTYQPLLQGLRVDKIPAEPPSCELARIYHESARLVGEIRPFLPQTLFGALLDDGGAALTQQGGGGSANPGSSKSGSGGSAGAATARETATALAADAAAAHSTMGRLFARSAKMMPWDAAQHSVRLDSAVCHTTCTLLTVVPLPNHKDLKSPDELLNWYNSLLATVIELTNRAGGAVHAVEQNGVIVCVWNLVSKTRSAAVIALRVARALVGSFAKSIDVNIVTGPCMVANAKTGRRRNVVIVGSALEFAERVLLLNRLHSSNIVMDFDSYRDLSLEEQTLCRPIALLHTGPSSRVVLYSADWTSRQPPNPRQRKNYAAAFALYQNGMFEDSLQLFTQYLREFGNDGSAEWIVSHLLVHKLKPVDTIASNVQVSITDRGGALTSIDGIAAFGGG